VDITALSEEHVLTAVKGIFLDEMDLNDKSSDESIVETDWLQRPAPE